MISVGVQMGTVPEQLNLTVSLRGTREERDDCQIFRLTGLLDAFSEPVFRKVIGDLAESGDSKNIILDLSGIDFVDSSGLGALVQLAKQIQEGGSFQLVSNPRVTQTVKLVKLEKFLSLRQSLDEAITNLSA